MPHAHARPAAARCSVTLLHGTGQKAQYNGELAHLGKRSGSWIAAALRSGKSVKWRSGHWEDADEESDPEAALDAAREEAQAQAAEIVASVHAASATVLAQHEGAPEPGLEYCDISADGMAVHIAHRSPFTSLPDALMVEILQALTTPDVCHVLQATRTLSALSRCAPFGECHLRDGVAVGDGVRPSKQLHFARRLGEAKAALRTMHIDCGMAELDVARYLLQECNTRHLARVTIRVERHCQRGQMSLGLEPPGTASSAHPLNVEDSDDALRREIAVTEVLGFFSVVIMPETARTLTGCLAQYCPNLSHLALVKQVDDVPSLARIKSLTNLEAHFLEADDINFVLAELPRLRHLAITGGNIKSLCNERIDLESASLEVIDLTAASKGLTFERIQCPALRHIRCGEYGGYGNGLIVAFRPNTLTPAMAPHGHLSFHPHSRYESPQPHDLSQLCVFGSLDSTFIGTDIECPHAVIEIPAECTVTWNSVSLSHSSHSSLSATAATTLAAFAHQFTT
jgi:hypothetical protein